MENPAIGSLMGTAKPAETKKTDQGDPGAFSSAMNEAVEGKGKAKKEAMVDEKAAKSDQESQKEKKKEAKVETKAQAKSQSTKGGAKLQTYLNTLALKDPAKLSIAERQALQVGEFAKEKVGLNELQRMLLDRGLNIRDLSYNQLTNLTQGGDQSRLARLLDQMVRDQLDRPETRTSTEQMVASASSNSQNRLEALMAEESMQLKEASKTGQSQRAEARQNLMDQILQHIEVRNLANQTEINLKLNPEYLGELKIRLSQGEDGIKAGFETSSKLTRELLEDHEDDLVSQVQAKGVDLQQVSVRLVEEVV